MLYSPGLLEAQYVTQAGLEAGLELMAVLPQPLEYWDHRHKPTTSLHFA